LRKLAVDFVKVLLEGSSYEIEHGDREMEKVTFEFEIDRQSLNNYLGNTPNVSLEDALSEFLECLFWVPYHCENCGRGGQEDTGVKGSYRPVK
jgi:hypothetical protein